MGENLNEGVANEINKATFHFFWAICYEGLIKVRDIERAGMECRNNRGAVIRLLVVSLEALLLP